MLIRTALYKHVISAILRVQREEISGTRIGSFAAWGPGELPWRLPRRELSSDSAGFAWVDARGGIRNLYTERLSSPVSAGNGREMALRKSFLACAEAPDGIVATRIGGDARDDDFDCDLLRPPGARHALFGIVREQSAALGQICLYRAAPAPAFGDCEREDLASVMRYVAQGVATRETRAAGDPLAFAYEDSEEEAML